MDRARKIALISYELEKARDDLETAKLDLRGGKYRGASNRAYYSAPTGLPISGQSRATAVAKSPLTGLVGDAQAGGFWPADLVAHPSF